MKISVIIPVYNEKDTIEEIVDRVLKVNLDKETIIVDDKSTDGTDDILREKFTNVSNVVLVFLERNRGKGFAIRTGLSYVKGDIVIIQDADLEYDPEDYKLLVTPINEQKTSVVYGSRFMHLNTLKYIWSWFTSKLKGKACKIGHIYFSNFLGIKFLNLLVLVLYGKRITDEATCYKVFKADIIKKLNLKCERFEFCPEVTAKIFKAGYDIYEVPISYYPRTTEHGKKLSWKDGLAAIKTLIKYRFKD
ncbi:MAG: glycosyltransferase family 2 protein [Candidatus Omnitrophota bacterium]